MQIQVRINEEGALRNQRYAFTDKFTLVSELMQNARRAGAQRIEITYDEASRVLRVIDDGCGIADFQKLLTLNEFGWDKPTCDAERPFGIGFSKCLYSASRCIVSSRNRKIDFLTRDALSRQPVDVLDIEDHPHTAVELHDVALPGLEGRLPILCSGFPVTARFNGSELPRLHAIGHRPFASTTIGQVYLAGTGDGEPVRQASDFIDSNDQFLDDHCEEDRDALADLIRRLRSVDPKATLDSLLQELKLEKYPLLRGRSFRLIVGHSHDGHVVEVMPSTQSPTNTGRP